MRSNVRWIVVAAGVLAAVGLFLLVRPEGPPEPPARTTQAAASPTSAPDGGSPEAAPPEGASPTGTQGPAMPSEAITVIRATVRGGRVDAPAEPAVARGDRVRIVVDADVADEIHLHGYDLSADVAPGRPGVLTFRASAAGVYEVELEDAGLLLFELTVNP